MVLPSQLSKWLSLVKRGLQNLTLTHVIYSQKCLHFLQCNWMQSPLIMDISFLGVMVMYSVCIYCNCICYIHMYSCISDWKMLLFLALFSAVTDPDRLYYMSLGYIGQWWNSSGNGGICWYRSSTCAVVSMWSCRCGCKQTLRNNGLYYKVVLV